MLSIGVATFFAISAASASTSAVAGLPARKADAFSALRGAEPTAPSQIAARSIVSPSTHSATAAESTAKSIDPRRRSFQKALRTRGAAEVAGTRIAVAISSARFAR